MFLKHYERSAFLDLSSGLRDAHGWDIGTLRSLCYHLDVCAFAVEPSAGLLAIGTAGGFIHIFGGYSVESKFSLPENIRIKFLQFAVSVYKLVCVGEPDERNRLYVWDLTTYGSPKLQKTVRLGVITALTLSPSHTHALLALESGEIMAWDLLCLQKSPYTIPNMWILYEKKLFSSGVPTTTGSESRIAGELVIHPRDLNLVFIAYGGGIILSDLTQRSTLRVYELTLLPGAPGGAGYGSHNLLSHRHPSVTAFAIHPAGHFFAVGYADGSIAFWAVEDEDQPISVRTIEEVDVHVVDGAKLEKYLAKDGNHDRGLSLDREPILKLAWSAFPNSTDPRGGETALTILGGLVAGETYGVTVLWMPAFNPREPPAVTGRQTSLHPSIQTAMQQSVMPSRSFNYSSSGIVQDFLLIPRDSPHFSGTFDPISILLLTEAHGGTRAIEAYQFPPPAFLIAASPGIDSTSSTSDLDNALDVVPQALTSILDSMQLSQDPERMMLPCPLWSGNNGVIGGQIVKLDPDSHRDLTRGNDDKSSTLPLRGGVAWSDENEAAKYKYAKPRRLLITCHFDLTIQFQDISTQLLITPQSNPMEHHFPEPLPLLTIDLVFLLSDPLVATQLKPTFLDEACIDSVELATESLECAAVFKTGEVMIFRLNTGQQQDKVFREAADKELTILEHLARDRHRRFYPYLMLAPGLGRVVTSAISDIGFFAASYADGTLLVVDMRGPKIILRFGQDKLRQSGLHLRHRSELISSLTWTVCGMSSDPQLHIRLLVVYTSGLTHIFTLVRSGSSFTINGDPAATETLASPIPRGSIVLDADTGVLWKATRDRLGVSLQTGKSKGSSHCLWVSSGAKGVRCVADIDGERVGKADWGNNVGIVQSVQIVGKNDSVVLVAFTEKQEALIYSLPKLEHLHTYHLPQITVEPISADGAGDFIQFSRHLDSGLINQIVLGTLFNIRRLYNEPVIDISSTRVDVPSQPQPVSVGPATIFSSLSSWVPFGQSLTGAQIDALLAGPERPLPVVPESKLHPAGSSNTTKKSLTSAGTDSNLYDRLASALTERGERIGDLQDHLNTLEEGSKNMAAQAKKIAAKQTAKSWFNV